MKQSKKLFDHLVEDCVTKYEQDIFVIKSCSFIQNIMFWFIIAAMTVLTTPIIIVEDLLHKNFTIKGLRKNVKN